MSTTTTAQLRASLAERQSFWSAQMLAALEPRKLEELEFHNLDRSEAPGAEHQRAALDMHANRKWYSVTKPSCDYVERWISENAPQRTFLDYACGRGGNALCAARSGASIAVGLDISDESIRLARAAASLAGLAGNTSFVQGDCERTGFPDSSFDRIICSGMLHHLDLEKAYGELRRILRPGGRILCIEALGHNPLIQAYRRQTPRMRTEWEARHILGVPDALRARRWFEVGEMRFWHLCDLASVPLRGSVLHPFALATGRLVDRLLLSTPGLRRMAWQFTFVLEHPDSP